MNEIEKIKKEVEILKHYDSQPYFFSKDASAMLAFKSAIEALEKQTPKKPLNVSTQIDHQHDAKQNVGECPNCKNNIAAYAWFKDTHCWICGQAIDWSVEEKTLELMNYEGCGKCEKRGEEFDCKANTVPVTIKFNKAQKWDCWGKMVTAFRKDEVVKGYAVIDDNKVYCASATSTVYEDIDDFIALEDIKITL